MSTSILYNIIARDGASKTFDDVGKSSGRLEKNLGGLGKALKVAAAGIGIAAAIGAESVKMAADFQTQMTRVQTGAGELKKNMGLVSSGVLDMAGQVGQSTSQLTTGLYTVESAGYHGADALNVLKNAAMGAKVGAADLGTVTDAVTTALNAYQMGAGSATKVTNALIGTEAEGKTTMEALAGSMSTVLPAAAAAHVGLNEVLGAMATMTSQGTQAKVAATYLRQVIGQLSNPSAKAANEMKTLGLNATQVGMELGKKGLAATLTTITDAIEKHMGPAGTVLIDKLRSASKNTTDYQKVLANLSPTQQTYIGAMATMVGGTKSMMGALELTGPHMTTFQKNTAGITKHVQDGGKAIEGWSDVSKTFNQKMAQLKDGSQALAIKIGTKLLPAVTKIAGAIGDHALPAVSKFAGFLMDTAAPAVTRFGSKILNDLVPVGTIKKDLGAATTDVSGFLKGLSGKSAQVSVTAHHAPIELPQSSSARMGTQVRKMFSGGISSGLQAVNWGKVGSILAKGLASSLGALTSLGTKIATTFATVVGKIDWVTLGKQVGGQAIPFVIGFVDNLLSPLFSGSFWKKHWTDVFLFAISVVPIGKIFDGVGMLVSKIPWGKLGDLFEKIPWGKIFNWAKPIVKTIGDATKGAVGWAGRLLGSVKNAFSTQFPRLAAWFGDQALLLPVRLGDLGRALRTKVITALNSMSQAILEMAPKAFRGLITSAAKVLGRFTFWETGIHLIEGLYNGITNKLSGGYKWVKSHIVDPVVDWVKNLFGVHSPSTVFAEIGGHLIGGLYGGILSGIHGVGGWLSSHVISPVTGAFSKAGSWLSSAGGHVISGLKNGISGALRGISGWIKSTIVDPVVKAVKHWFGIRSPSTVMAELGGHLTGGLLKGMAEKGGTDIAKKVFGDLPHALEHIVGKGLVSLGSLPGKALSALGGLGSKVLGFLGLGGGGSKGGVGQWSGDVAEVLSLLGAPSSALSAVLTRIGIESGGNPKAINLWDSNAKAGHPSQGLMQTIPGTFAHYAGPFRGRGITDPLANIYAGINYAMHRYGKNWIKIMTRPGGYAKGGTPHSGEVAWVGEKGPELLRFGGNERIYSHRDSMNMTQPRPVQPITISQPDVHVHVNFKDEALQFLAQFIDVRVEHGHEALMGALDSGEGWT